MARIETWFEQDLQKPVSVRVLTGNLFSMDNQGNLIGVKVLDGGEAATLSGTVSGNVIRQDGGTVAVSGTLSGNQASIVLPQAAYAVPGLITITIKLTSSSVVTTLAALTAVVYRTSTDVAVDPGTLISDINTLIAAIDTAVASIPADYSSLWTSLAPAFSTSTAYVAGQYVTYNGGLYRFTTAHAAGSWNSAHVTDTKLGPDIADLKSALSDNTGTEIIAISETSKYIQMTGDTAVVKSSANFKYSKVPCQQGDVFTVNAEGAGGARCWGWLDTNDGVLDKAGEGASVTNKIIVSPADGYLVINNKVTNDYVSYKGIIIKDIVDKALIYEENPTNDLNDFVKPGYYHLDSTAGYYTHSPTENGSAIPGSKMLQVMPTFVSNSAYCIQLMWILSNTYEGNIYARRRTGSPSSNTWTDWIKVSSIKDMNDGFDVSFMRRDNTGITDLDNATEKGYYNLASTTDYDHLPSEVRPHTSGALSLFVYNDPSGYMVQELIMLSSTYAGSIYVRRKTGEGWTDWIKVCSKKDFDTLSAKVDSIVPNTISESFIRSVFASQGANVGQKLRVMSYNICHFNNDTATYISDEKLCNLKKAFYKANADIVGTQEDSLTIDGSSASSDSYFYYPLYPYKIGGQNPSIHSKFTYGENDMLEYSNGRFLRYGVYTISESITLLVVSTHPVANYDNTGATSAESIAQRAIQYDELFKWVNGDIDLISYASSSSVHVPTHTHCVICGDFNSLTSSDKSTLLEKASAKNFVAGNGGAIGWFITAMRDSNSALDNIFVSNNIIINSIEAYNDWYDRLYSDHVPVVADLTLLES